MGTEIGDLVQTRRATTSRRDPRRDASAALESTPGDRNAERTSCSKHATARRRSPSSYAATTMPAYRTAQARLEGPTPAAVASKAALWHARTRCTAEALSTGRLMQSESLVPEESPTGCVPEGCRGTERGASLPRTTARLTPPVSSSARATGSGRCLLLARRLVISGTSLNESNRAPDVGCIGVEQGGQCVHHRRPVPNRLQDRPDATSSCSTSRPGIEMQVVDGIATCAILPRVTTVAVVAPHQLVLQRRTGGVGKAPNAVPHVGYKYVPWGILHSPPRLTHRYVKRIRRKPLHRRHARDTYGTEG